ncbi:MAG: hypothetical protein EZS28_039039 [Streblomastix strix]|uniref:Uncharacterized protein n=1 Tax=Streblomastix strix TaxID=222440 RepID=A0A5J4U6S9_9EUKA|nr:MAG: hypothetical protein EZS28_039039 [Streblomastix strix]
MSSICIQQSVSVTIVLEAVPIIEQLFNEPPFGIIKLIIKNNTYPETLKYTSLSINMSLTVERLVEFLVNLLADAVYVIARIMGRDVLSYMQTLQALAVLRLFIIVFAFRVLHGLDEVHVRVSSPDPLTQQSNPCTSNKQ